MQTNIVATDDDLRTLAGQPPRGIEGALFKAGDIAPSPISLVEPKSLTPKARGSALQGESGRVRVCAEAASGVVAPIDGHEYALPGARGGAESLPL